MTTENRQKAWEARQELFRQSFPDGSAQFFRELWDYPAGSVLQEWGRHVGASMEGNSRTAGKPDAGAGEEVVLAGLVDGSYRPLDVSAELLERSVRESEGAWLSGGYWEQVVKQHGESALELAKRVHEVEENRSRNHIRSARLDLDANDDKLKIPYIVEGIFPAGTRPNQDLGGEAPTLSARHRKARRR